MKKTHAFLEKLDPKSVNREDKSVNWSTLLTGLQNPQTNHIIISRGDENEQKLIRSRRREKMRGRAQEWNREREAGTWEALVCSVRGERKKKSEKEVFILYKDNIILMDKRVTVTV